MTFITFPRSTPYADAPVDPEIQRRRDAFAAKLTERRGLAAETLGNPELEAEAFGRRMFALCGKNWSSMISLAAGAAMKAQMEALDKALP
jgi:hypothetical protein